MEYVLFLFLIVYLMPWIFAEARDHGDASRILLLNVLLGWTLLGWIAAWLWAGKAPPRPVRGGPAQKSTAPERPALRVIRNPDAEPTPRSPVPGLEECE